MTFLAAVGARLMSRPARIRAYAEDALERLAGLLVPRVHPPIALAHAAEAHRALESRATTGKVVLVP